MRAPKPKHKHKKRPAPRRTCDQPASLCCLLLGLLLLPSNLLAFCPARCTCDDLQLSANCSLANPSLRVVPMTLNPLLRRLTLSNLRLADLSDSLSIYRRLERLDLSANELTRISYENFNFRPPPPELAARREPDARHLRQALGRSGADSADEIGFHLRELLLADNRIELLGAGDAPEEPDAGEEAAGERGLERAAPFLMLVRLERLSLAGNRIARLRRHALLGPLHLRELDLSRNRLEWLHQSALVGLVALERLDLRANRLARHLARLGAALCRAPAQQLAELRLGDNAELAAEVQLPSQLLVCAPKLRRLELRNASLRHLQTSALDGLPELEALDLAANPLDQVPSDALSLARANLSLSLRELDLSATNVEFVNADSFGALKNLRRLRMDAMPRLLSFDLAAFSLTLAGPPDFRLANERLEELHLSANPRLQSVHSSVAARAHQPSGRIHFTRLKLLALAQDPELAELPLTEVIGAQQLAVQLHHSGNFNCSSCQMRWLLAAARPRAPLDPHQRPAPFRVEGAESVGCAWPSAGPAELCAERHAQQSGAEAAAASGEAPLLLPLLLGCASLALVLVAATLVRALASRRRRAGYFGRVQLPAPLRPPKSNLLESPLESPNLEFSSQSSSTASSGPNQSSATRALLLPTSRPSQSHGKPLNIYAAYDGLRAQADGQQQQMANCQSRAVVFPRRGDARTGRSNLFSRFVARLRVWAESQSAPDPMRRCDLASPQRPPEIVFYETLRPTPIGAEQLGAASRRQPQLPPSERPPAPAGRLMSGGGGGGGANLYANPSDWCADLSDEDAVIERRGLGGRAAPRQLEAIGRRATSTCSAADFGAGRRVDDNCAYVTADGRPISLEPRAPAPERPAAAPARAPDRSRIGAPPTDSCNDANRANDRRPLINGSRGRPAREGVATGLRGGRRPGNRSGHSAPGPRFGQSAPGPENCDRRPPESAESYSNRFYYCRPGAS